MADEEAPQESPEPQETEYTEEELSTIGELTEFFLRAPGQVDVPEEEMAEGEEEGEEEPEAAEGEEETVDEGPPAPKVDLDKYADDDIDALLDPDAPAPAAEPAPEEAAEAPGLEDLGDLGEAPSEAVETPPEVGELPDIGDMDLGEPTEAAPETPTEAAPAEAGEEPPAGGEDLGGIDELGGLDDLGGIEAAAEEAAEPAPAEAGEPAIEAPGLEDFGALDDLGAPPEAAEPEAAESAAADEGEAPDLGDLGDLGDMGGLEPTPAEAAEAPPAEGGLDDLGGLGDLGDMGDMGGLEPAAADAAETEPADDMGDLGDLGDMGGLEEPAGEPEAPAGEGDLGDLGGLGDLGDMGGLEETSPAETTEPTPAPALSEVEGEAGDAGLGELGDLGDMGDLGGLEAAPAEAGEPAAPDLGSLDDMGAGLDTGPDLAGGLDEGAALEGGLEEGADLGAGLDEGPALDAGPDLEGGLDAGGDLGGLEEPAADVGGAPAPPSLDDLSPEVALQDEPGGGDLDLSGDLSAMAQEQQGDDLSDEEIRQLRAALKGYPPGVRKAAIDAIIEDQINDEQTRELTSKILAGAETEEIKGFLAAATGAEIDDTPEVVRKKAKVIVARPQYTADGLKRQAKMLRYARWGALAALLIFGVGLSLWTFVFKGMIYRNYIAEGKELIMRNAPQPPGEKAVIEAEKLFEKALGYYGDKSYAYLQYGEAYRRVGLYQNSFDKLFGQVGLAGGKKAMRYRDRELKRGVDFWGLVKKVPVVRYLQKNEQAPSSIAINNMPWTLFKPGAYTITHLDKKRDEAEVLLALGEFHSSRVARFRVSPYRNNLLGIDYFRRILTFNPKTPWFEKETFQSAAIEGIGNVYYNQKEYYRALDYYKKIIDRDPYNIAGQTGVLKALLQVYNRTNDPRMVIQQHSIIIHKLGIEDKLPLYMLARLAAFYIDLPGDTDLRIKYNVSPMDKVSETALRDRAPQLLAIMAAKTEEDAYGNVTEGKRFAEGYYQLGRYHRKVSRRTRMAMKQMEYAFKYDPRHFLALNQRAEMLMGLKDYAAAVEHLKLAETRIGDDSIKALGDRPEDETLMEADRGIIPFNIGKAVYLSTVKDLGDTEDWLRMREAEKYRGKTDYGLKGLSSRLRDVERNFERALGYGLKSQQAQAELRYYSGWAYYVRNQYRSALAEWEQMALHWQRRYKNLELAKSHALYQLSTAKGTSGSQRQKHLRVALGYLFFLQEHYTDISQKIPNPSASNKHHLELFSRLAIIENNIGAIYELMNVEKKALQHYWKSVDYSKRISRENEVANLNIRLSFKRKGLTKESVPVIMDFIPPELSEETL